MCYICEEQGKGSRATVGACMQCNKTGCRQQFHVTCAQALGLLCEEAGNYLDNVKYCGYCQYHYSKLVSITELLTSPHVTNCFFLRYSLILFTFSLFPSISGPS